MEISEGSVSGDAPLERAAKRERPEPNYLIGQGSVWTPLTYNLVSDTWSALGGCS